MTTPIPTQRVAPPLVADERAMLAAWLDYHRATLETKCTGVSEEALRERLEGHPSPLSLLGLVRHMADVERAWFRRRVAAENAPPLYYSEDDPDGDFDNVDSADVAEAFATWRAECQRAREIVAAAVSLDDMFDHRDERVSLRWVLVHMVEEYARHNGHADLLRERIDGATGN
ncbi:MAG: DinB family protein [Pseudonocardiaceae bacterium]